MGDTLQISIANAVPNQSVSVTTSGASNGTTQMGQTDSNGNFTYTAVEQASGLGSFAGQTSDGNLQGVSTLSITNGVVSTYSATTFDYAVSAYYDTNTVTTLFDNGTAITQKVTGITTNTTTTLSTTANAWDDYDLQTDHYAVAFFVSGSGNANPYYWGDLLLTSAMRNAGSHVATRLSSGRYLIFVFFVIAISCSQHSMQPYPELVDLFTSSGTVLVPPVVIVAKVLSCDKVGSPTISNWDPSTTFQQYRVGVRVENVLGGSVPTTTTDIYFLRNQRPVGLKLMGFQTDFGAWKYGDRVMFSLQRDADRLRTVCDTYAHCTVKVLSGFHANLARENSEDLIVNILLTRGSKTTDAEMVQALDKTADIAFRFAPRTTIARLEAAIQTESPLVRLQACSLLRMESQYPYPFGPELTKEVVSHPNYAKALGLCPATNDK